MKKMRIRRMFFYKVKLFFLKSKVFNNRGILSNTFGLYFRPKVRDVSPLISILKQTKPVWIFVLLCGDFCSYRTALEERARAPGREARIYVSGCESMDLNESDLGHQAVLSDHAWFEQYRQVRTAACSTVE